jgi:predicted nucleotide-binding protein (sugar kinase/HSP70/actin superfamily)
MIAMLNEGIDNIVCLQPFGCIANHITGKGMENKLREMFPHLNLLSLDMDAGASEVNLLNRLHYMGSRPVKWCKKPPGPFSGLTYAAEGRAGESSSSSDFVL